jgi:ActR/RegA family two-component response regulator
VSEVASGLEVAAILADPQAVALLGRVVSSAGDRLSVSDTVVDGLGRVSSSLPDVALVDVALGQGAGLALIHHIRALAPGVPIYALAQEGRIELGTHAMALGATGVLVLPLTGDAVLTTLSDVRARRAQREQVDVLTRREQASRLESALFSHVAELVDCETRREATERLVELLSDAGARRAVVYLPAGEGARQLLRASARGLHHDSPAFCEELELNAFAEEHGLGVVRLALRRELAGVLLIDGMLESLGPEAREELLGALGVQAATVLALIGAREEAQRGGMKDPRSSAYTFAYFVDVAGREIDMARRHRRRFALTTIGVHERVAAVGEAPEPTLATVEPVLGVVRDTDVLARVDANEFYLLLPETSGLGAHACRRRVLDKLATAGHSSRYEIGVGVAVYPHDGGDLSRLLRVARHRAEVCRVSAVTRLGLRDHGLPDIEAARLAEPAGVARDWLEAPRVVELPTTDVVGLVLAAVRAAARGGALLVAKNRPPGGGIGGAHSAAGARAHPKV